MKSARRNHHERFSKQLKHAKNNTAYRADGGVKPLKQLIKEKHQKEVQYLDTKTHNEKSDKMSKKLYYT